MEHNKIIHKLLFELSTWHGLAKLHLHTESSIIDLENSISRLGEILHQFSGTVCPAYATYELPSEEATHVQRKATVTKKAKSQSPKKKTKKSTQPPPVEKKKAAPTKPKGSSPTSNSKATGSSRRRSFNLVTYKLHALGWYPRAIRLYGTSDNYNTQMVRFFFFTFKS